MAGPVSTPSPDPSADAHADERPLVYFFCLGNAMRSQMAEGFLRQHAGDRFRVASAGTHPLGYVLPEVVRVMREKDIELRHHQSTAIDPTIVANAAHLVDLGCHAHEHLPADALPKLLVWPVQDPYGMGLRTLREVRDEIEARVRDFITQQDAAEHATAVRQPPR